MRRELEKDVPNAVAEDVFGQASEGLAVPVDPEYADMMGAFTEDAVTLEDIMSDMDRQASEVEGGTTDER